MSQDQMSLDALDDSSKFHILKLSGLDAQIAMGIVPQQFRLYTEFKGEKARSFVKILRALSSFLHHLNMEFGDDGWRFLDVNDSHQCMFDGKIDDFDYNYAKSGLKVKIEVQKLYNFVDHLAIDELRLAVDETDFLQVYILAGKMQMYQKLVLSQHDEKIWPQLVCENYHIEIDAGLLSQIVRKFQEFKTIKFEIVDDKIRIKSTKPSGESMTMSLRCDGERQHNYREVDVAQYISSKILLYIRSDKIAIQLKDADHPLIIAVRFGSNQLLFGLPPQNPSIKDSDNR